LDALAHISYLPTISMQTRDRGDKDGLSNLMNTSIFQTLEQLGLTSKQSRVLFNDRTRDMERLKVWKDVNSGVIYIDEFSTDDAEYVSGKFRDEIIEKFNTGSADYERHVNNERRFKSYFQHVAEKRVADFGCGKGFFLRKIQPH